MDKDRNDQFKLRGSEKAFSLSLESIIGKSFEVWNWMEKNKLKKWKKSVVSSKEDNGENWTWQRYILNKPEKDECEFWVCSPVSNWGQEPQKDCGQSTVKGSWKSKPKERETI